MNVGLSVSRVGGDAQTKAMKKSAGSLRLELAQYREMEVFTQFSSDLDELTRKQLAYGQGLMRLMRQPQCRPMSRHREVMLLTAALGRAFQDVPAKKLESFRSEFLEDIERRCPELCEAIDSTGLLSDEDRQTVLDRAKSFTKGWLEAEVS